MSTTIMQDIIHFWFVEHGYQDWFQNNSAFDDEVHAKFKSIHTQACANELHAWRKTPEGSLAEIIILDQFSRQIYRDDKKAFAQDAHSLALAQIAIEKKFDQPMPVDKRQFFYLPFMHSESLAIHKEALKLYEHLNSPISLEYELKHYKIIEQFGRYPHRNKILGRTSTKAELLFLQQPDSSF